MRFEFSLNPSTALLKLQRGDVNVLGDYIPPAEYVRVKNDPVASKLVVEEPVIAIDYLFLNRTVKPFDNPKVRQAVSMAVDRTRIVKLLSGAADPLTQLYPAGLPGHQDGAAGEFYAYDPAKAKQLLAEAGFPNGFSTTLYSHNVDPWPKVLQSVQQDLKEIGITADLKILDRATYWTLIGKPGKCGVGLNDWWMDFPDPSDFIIPLYSKSTAIDEGTNPSFWWSPETETMIDEAQANTDADGAHPAVRGDPEDDHGRRAERAALPAQGELDAHRRRGQLLPAPGVDLRLPGVLLHDGAVADGQRVRVHLAQPARAVRVEPARQREVQREQLPGDDRGQRRERLGHWARQRDDRRRAGGSRPAAAPAPGGEAVDDQDGLRAAPPQLDLELRAPRRASAPSGATQEHGVPRLDHRDGAVAQVGGRERHRRQIARLLDLERDLERGGVVEAAPGDDETVGSG